MAEVTEIRRFKKALDDPYNFTYFYAEAVIEDTDDSVVSVLSAKLKVPTANTEANLKLFSDALVSAESKPLLEWTF